MFYNVLYPLADEIGLFNLFRYLTFRSGGALMTSLIICFICGPWIIRMLRARQGKGQPIREDGPESHVLTKQGTPTMGGFMILLAVVVSTLLWADVTNIYVWVVLGVTLGYGLIGFADDYLKVARRNHKGLPGRFKLLGQFGMALVMVLAIQYAAEPKLASHLALPMLKSTLLDLGWFYVVFAMLVIVGSSNAVNLTDGLDGLAIVPIMIATATFAIISYVVGNMVFAGYLQVHAVPGSGELAVFCAAVVGASLGFLWYNAPPAMIFMGDTGSLSLGGAIGTIAVITKHELVLVIVGGVFVMEAVSVILQVGSFKMTGKRVFRMAPIHHHFEKKGWEEPTVVIRFWIIAAILALVGLATLKLR